MSIKDKCVLHIGGHVENNTGYYEEYNSNYSIDSDLLLEEGNSIRKIGYEIKVNKIYDQYVELIINNERIISLRPKETQYIVSKDEVIGRNENFKIDRELLFVELKEVDVDRIRHIIEYKDYKPQIDNNLEKIKCLLSYYETYFDIQNYLKTILFRLIDKNYLEKVTVSNNIEAIKERNKWLPYRNVIENLIDDIDSFEKENKKVFEAIIKKQTIDARDFNVISTYLSHLAESNSSHDKIPFDRLEEFLDVVLNNTKIESDYDYTLLHYYLVKVVSRHRYYFKHAYLAHRVSFNIRYVSDSLKELRNQRLYEMMIAVGDFLLLQYNRKDAMECYEEASDIALEDNDLLNSAYALQKYYRINSQFPERLQKKVDINEIEKIYKKHAEIVLSGVNYKGLKVDEVEFTAEFVNKFQYVMLAVEKEIDKVGDLHIPYQRWSLMQKYYYEKYNIIWKTPKEMNPRVMFD